jgi:hypothetical protein
MVGQLGDGQTLAAQGSMTDRGIRIPLNFYHLAVFHMGDDTAASMATPTSCSDFFNPFHHFSSFSITEMATFFLLSSAL